MTKTSETVLAQGLNDLRQAMIKAAESGVSPEAQLGVALKSMQGAHDKAQPAPVAHARGSDYYSRGEVRL